MNTSPWDFIETYKEPWEYTLQELILDVIMKNFEFFIKEYDKVLNNNPRSKFPKQFFTFLQRKYSAEILRRLVKENNFRTRYLDFILNPHLKEIDFSTLLEGCDSFVLSRKLLIVSKNLVKLSAMGSENFESVQRSLFYMKNLQELRLDYAGISDMVLEMVIDCCPLLTLLSVYGSYITDDGMKYLCNPRGNKLELQYLNIERTFVKPEGVLLVLQNIKTLEHIFYEKLSFVVSDAGQNKVFTKENCLSIKDIKVMNVNNELKICSELCPHVKNLVVRAINNAEQLNYCLNFKEVEDVNMTFNRSWPSIMIDPFLENCGSRIHTLILRHFTVSVDVLCKYCPLLSFLELEEPIFSMVSKNIAPDLKFNHLMHFKIFGTLLSVYDQKKAVNFILMLSPNLISFALQDCVVDKDMLDSIFRSPASFTNLNFSGTTVDANFLENILRKYNRLLKLVVNNSFNIRRLNEIAISLGSRCEIVEYLYHGLRRM